MAVVPTSSRIHAVTPTAVANPGLQASAEGLCDDKVSAGVAEPHSSTRLTARPVIVCSLSRRVLPRLTSTNQPSVYRSCAVRSSIAFLLYSRAATASDNKKGTLDPLTGKPCAPSDCVANCQCTLGVASVTATLSMQQEHMPLSFSCQQKCVAFHL